MKRRVVKSLESRRDVLGSSQFIAGDNETAAHRFLTAVDASLQKLLQAPELGERLATTNPSLQDLRVWPVQRFRNFLIFYREVPDGIKVVRILHGARDWQAILGT